MHHPHLVLVTQDSIDKAAGTLEDIQHLAVGQLLTLFYRW